MDDADGTTAGRRVLAHVRVSGRVRGVGYRAAGHGVDGWVRNLADSRVKAVFEGPRDAVAPTVEWCHEGRPAARVDGVDVAREPAGHDGFEARR